MEILESVLRVRGKAIKDLFKTDVVELLSLVISCALNGCGPATTVYKRVKL